MKRLWPIACVLWLACSASKPDADLPPCVDESDCAVGYRCNAGSCEAIPDDGGTLRDGGALADGGVPLFDGGARDGGAPLCPADAGIRRPDGGPLLDTSWRAMAASTDLYCCQVVAFNGTNQRLVAQAQRANAPSELWSLSLSSGSTWTRAPAPVDGGAPSVDSGYPVVVDAPRGRALVLANRIDSSVWSLSLSDTPSWSSISTGGSSPLPNGGYNTLAVAAGDRAIVINGYYTAGQFDNVFALTLTDPMTWSTVATAGTRPAPRYQPAIAYDLAGERLLVYGGQLNDGSMAVQTFALSVSGTPTWTQLSTEGTPPDISYPRAVYDPAGQRMIVFGSDRTGGQVRFAALSLSGTPTWSDLPTSPELTASDLQFGSVAHVDPANQRVLFLLQSRGGVTAPHPFVAGLWSLSSGSTPAWSRISTASPIPPGDRSGHSASFDPNGHRAIFFGGIRPRPNEGLPSTYSDELWGLPGADGARWRRLFASGTGPSARAFHSSVVDTHDARLVVFGGYDGRNRNDVFAATLSDTPVWSPLAPAGTAPTPRRHHAAIYDEVGGRMLVFGGWAESVLGDLFSLSLGGTPAWTELHPTGASPPPRFGASALYEATGKRLLLYGGVGVDGRARGDLWALSLEGTLAWTELSTTGLAPEPRYAHVAVSAGAQMIVFGGESNRGPLGDAFMLSLSSPLTWTPYCPVGPAPGARAFGAGLFDLDAAKLVLVGGREAADDWTFTLPMPD